MAPCTVPVVFDRTTLPKEWLPGSPQPSRVAPVSRSRFLDSIRESNRQAQGAWARWAPHRDRVMALLEGPTYTRSLGILGAGQLNDVRLDVLLRRCGTVTLVDVDADTVRSAVIRHGLVESRACRVHSPVDLGGILDQLPFGPAAGGMAAQPLVATLASHHCEVRGQPFDLTASLGVLTQLHQSVVDSSLRRDDVARVCIAVRDKHLRDLVQLTRPGGIMVLVTDVVSTATTPDLPGIPPVDLERRMAELVATRNFFTGTNPYRIVGLLEEDDRFRELVANVRLVDPWLWAVTEDQQYLTCAIVAERRAEKPGRH